MKLIFSMGALLSDQNNSERASNFLEDRQQPRDRPEQVSRANQPTSDEPKKADESQRQETATRGSR